MISLRAYARHRKAAGLTGGTLRAVQVAIRDGRLSKSITEDGKIRAAEEADHEWAATTLADRIPSTGPTAPKTPTKPKTPASRTTQAAVEGGPPALEISRRRKEAALATLAERQLAEHEGKYLETAIVRRDVSRSYRTVMARMLAVPSLLMQRRGDLASPDLMHRICAVVDGLIRDGLTELADGHVTVQDEVDEKNIS